MNKRQNQSRLYRLILLLAVAACGAMFARAQVTTGSLQGVVKDGNAAVVVGATVKITNTATGATRETTTNSEGFYRVTNLLPGDSYTVEVTAQGYEVSKRQQVAVRLASENSLDLVLGVQGVAENVTITGGEQALIQSTQSQLSASFSPTQLQQLPLNGAGIDSLALLVPGVVPPGGAAFSNGVGISANGNRGRSNNFQIDGQDNNDNSVAGPSLTLTNTEAVGELQVITNSFSAEFGRNSGAQVNTITRAGTNEFHGSLFAFHNNSSLTALTNLQKVNANGFRFLSQNGFSDFSGLTGRQGVDPFRTNRFGGAVGGPIKKNKAFFFVTYQGNYATGETAINGLGGGGYTFDRSSALLARQLFPNPATAALVSTGIGGGPAFVQGVGQLIVAPAVSDLNGDGVPDSFNFGPGNPFGNPVTANRLNPSLFVRDSGGNLRTLFTGEPVRVVQADNSTDELITREDINLTDKDIISVRYIYNNARFPLGAGRFLAGAAFDVPSTNNNLGTTYTRTISSRLVNEARFNYSLLKVGFGDPEGPLPGPGIAFSGQRDESFVFSSLAFGTQNNLPQSRRVGVYQLQDTVSTTLGSHAVKFGGDVRFQRTRNFFLPNFLGTYTFRGSSLSGTVPANTFYDADGNSRAGAPAHAFENFLLNRPRDINFAVGSPRTRISQNDYFFFAQDDWRARPNLTLNLGLRYELSTQPLNGLIDTINAREADASTSIFGATFPLETRTANNLPLDKNNFGPRVGFAWSPDFKALGERFTGGRTVLRGGFGIAYDPGFYNIVLNTITAAPFVGAGTVRQNNPDLAGTVGIPFLPNTTAQLQTTPGTNGGDPRLFNQTRVADDFRNPYTISYNFGLQQELGKNTVLEARYVGSRIVGQFQTINGNPNVQFLNRAAQCLGLPNGQFSNGIVVGAPAASAAAACNGSGFNNRAGTNGNGRVDPNFGVVRTRLNGASSTYNGLQARFDTRFSNVFLNANYTWSKAIDNSSEIFGTGGGGGQDVAASQNPFDITDGERGLSAFHQAHTFTANFSYDLPFAKEQKGFIGRLLGGYQFTGFLTLGSGRPYTAQQIFGNSDAGFEGAFLGSGTLRPFVGNPNAPNGTIAFGALAAANIIGDTRANAGQFIVYNTLSPGSSGVVVSAAQALQQARLIYNDFGLLANGVSIANAEAFNLFRTPYGNLGRNSLLGDAAYNVNLALFKTTRLTERTKLEFRAEATNLLNTRNFGVPTVFTEFAYTAISGTRGVVGPFQNPGFNGGQSRNIRLGMRFIF